jgi:CheY-like chemotaxis protein
VGNRQHIAHFRLARVNIVIVEDEHMVAARLKRFITEALAGQTHRVTHFSLLGGVKENISNTAPDIVFLDLNLNGEDGFKLLHWSLAGPYQTIIASARLVKSLRCVAANTVCAPGMVSIFRGPLTAGKPQESFGNKRRPRIKAP